MSRVTTLLLALLALAGAAIVARGSKTRLDHTELHTLSPTPRAVSGASDAMSAQKPSGSCLVKDLRLAIPLNGEAEKDWVIANYIDLDPAVGSVRDYTGSIGDNAVTYDGHTGIDFEVASFREVDLNVPVLASADGVVEETYAQSPDHNRVCSSDRWNYVKLRHANGYTTLYGHMKRNSIVVAVGERVRTGQKLGVVGSSGCSSHPHVHLEAIDCIGQVVDIMIENLFASPPQYSRDAPTTVMEVTVFQPAVDSYLRIQDPGPADVGTVSAGQEMSVGVTISHLHAGDLLRIEFLTPENSLADFAFAQTSPRYFTRSHWWGNFNLKMPGPWLARVKVNDRILAERPISVVTP